MPVKTLYYGLRKHSLYFIVCELLHMVDVFKGFVAGLVSIAVTYQRDFYSQNFQYMPWQ